MEERHYGKVRLGIFPTREEMGQVAADDAALCIRKLLEVYDEVNCVFAAAPSQNEFLSALVQEEGIDWGRVNAFHMDEYIGLGIEDHASFSNFLRRSIFSHVPFKSVNYINGKNDATQECRRYSNLLGAHKIHITFMGIGENGHIAFNDPGVADFHDSQVVKIVELDSKCRMQQVHDKCFDSIDQVPTHALTVTIPTLVSSEHIFCIVPSKTKSDAVRNALIGEVCEACPASILRNVDNVRMYVDEEAASLL